MTEKEKRELDAFCAEHVMGLALCNREPAILNPNEFVLSIPNKIVRARIWKNPTINFKPTTDHASAMEVLKKCVEQCDMPVEIDRKRDKNYETGHWRIESGSQGLLAIAPHECNTLELAICLFAKKLFSK